MIIENTLKEAFVGKQIRSLNNHDGVPGFVAKGFIVTDVTQEQDDQTGTVYYCLSGTLKGKPESVAITHKSEIEWVNYKGAEWAKVSLNGLFVLKEDWVFLDLENEDLMDARGGTRTVLKKQAGKVVIENINAN